MWEKRKGGRLISRSTLHRVGFSPALKEHIISRLKRLTTRARDPHWEIFFFDVSVLPWRPKRQSERSLGAIIPSKVRWHPSERSRRVEALCLWANGDCNYDVLGVKTSSSSMQGLLMSVGASFSQRRQKHSLWNNKSASNSLKVVLIVDWKKDESAINPPRKDCICISLHHQSNSN